MLTLYMDGKPADLQPAQQVKLTTKAARAGQATSSFTLEITLPLLGSSNNQALLPLAQYATKCKEKWAGKRWRAHLLSEGRTILRGVATLTKLTHEAASVQILSGGAIYSHAVAGSDKLYIDELPLGGAYDDLLYAENPNAPYRFAGNMAYFLDKCFNDDHWNARLYAPSAETPAVFFPIENNDDTQRANPMAVFGVEDGQGGVNTRWGFLIAYRDGRVPISTEGRRLEACYMKGGAKNLEQTPAVQPYLVEIIERVLAAVGLELRKEDNMLRRTPMLSELFVANGRHTLRYNEALPHWTVKEFFDHLQTLLGVTLYVDLQGRVKLEAAASEDVYVVDKVLDGYSCEFDTSEGDRAGDRRLATHYGDTFDMPEQNINPELWARASKARWDRFDNPPETEDVGVRHTVYLEAGADATAAPRYAYVKRGDVLKWEQVDVLGAKIDEDYSRQQATAASITPATIIYKHQGRLRTDHTLGNIERYARAWLLKPDRQDFLVMKTRTIDPTAPKYHHPSIISYGGEVAFPVISTKMQVGPSEQVFDVDLATELTKANPDIVKPAAHDTLQLCINASGGRAPHIPLELETKQQFQALIDRKPDALLFDVGMLRGANVDDARLSEPFSLYLQPKYGRQSGWMSTIGDLHALHANAVAHTTGVQYTFSFVADEVPSADQVFVIKGKRYGCVSLEATYTHEGLKTPIEGKFYEIV